MWTKTHLPFSLSSLSLMHFDSFLKSRLDFALSLSTMRFWRCHSLQLRFSRRWPCSRKLATFVQTLIKFSEGLRGEKGRGGAAAHLPGLGQRICIAQVAEGHEGLVPLGRGQRSEQSREQGA